MTDDLVYQELVLYPWQAEIIDKLTAAWERGDQVIFQIPRSQGRSAIAREVRDHFMENEPLTCQYTTHYQEPDNTVSVIKKCYRTDFEVVAMSNDDYVRLCPRHRSWAVAMGRKQDGE